MPTKRVALVWLLRILGAPMLLAAPFVFIPTAWLAAIHEWLTLGPFPPGAITEYLARSLSAFYAGAGALALLLSTDVVRYRPVILFVAGGTVVFALVVLWIDLKIGMPASWTWGEGPFVLPFGLVMWWLATGIGNNSD